MRNYIKTSWPHGLISIKGFTLIEMMIVVAIIGILAAIAYPSYSEQVKRGKRAEATSAVMEVAQFAQRFYVANSTYDGVSEAIDKAGLNRVPKDPGMTKTYDMDIDPREGGRGFIITASPLDDTKCGKLTLDSLGKKDAEFSTPVDCWK